MCQVYGETSFELVSRMLEAIPLNEEDSFIDLGSGMSTLVNVNLHLFHSSEGTLSFMQAST